MRQTLISLFLLSLMSQVQANALVGVIKEIDIYTQEPIYSAYKFDVYKNNSSFPHHQIIDVGNIEQLEQIISSGLPATESAAKVIAKQRLTQYQSQIILAWKNHVVISRLRLTHMPAIVFNGGEAVWYGGRLDQAIAAFYEFKKRQQ